MICREKIERYQSLLRAHPLDVACIGIGENGHIAFNDPPVADFDDPHLVKEGVELDDGVPPAAGSRWLVRLVRRHPATRAHPDGAGHHEQPGHQLCGAGGAQSGCGARRAQRPDRDRVSGFGAASSTKTPRFCLIPPRRPACEAGESEAAMYPLPYIRTANSGKVDEAAGRCGAGACRHNTRTRGPHRRGIPEREAMNAQKLLLVPALITGASLLACSPRPAQIPIAVEGEQAGTPVTFGIPFPRGGAGLPRRTCGYATGAGEEIPSQITPVTTWGLADESLKWIWVDFFTDGSGRYTVEYGPEARRTVEVESPLRFVNNQRQNGFAEIDTGPLRIRVQKGGSGFIDRIEFNPAGDGFGPWHVIAEGIGARGSFLDLVDADGLDASSAVIHQTFVDRGSGPMHAILRIEGEYRYQRPEHPPSPFVTYIHAYAGKGATSRSSTPSPIPETRTRASRWRAGSIATWPPRGN